MSVEVVNLDLRALSPNEQVDRLKKQFILLCGSDEVAVVDLRRQAVVQLIKAGGSTSLH